jgi:hypothetical protein
MFKKIKKLNFHPWRYTQPQAVEQNIFENKVEILQQMLFCSQVITIVIHTVLNIVTFLTSLMRILILLLHICEITRPYYTFLC